MGHEEEPRKDLSSAVPRDEVRARIESDQVPGYGAVVTSFLTGSFTRATFCPAGRLANGTLEQPAVKGPTL